MTVTKIVVGTAFREYTTARGKKRLYAADLGGHDPELPILYGAWLSKQAVSASLNKNWKRRYFIIRKDRLEYHWKCPEPQHIPRGVVKLSQSTAIEMVPSYREGYSVLKVEDDVTQLYIAAVDEKEITQLAENLKSTINGTVTEVSAPTGTRLSNEDILKAEAAKAPPDGDGGSDSEDEEAQAAV